MTPQEGETVICTVARITRFGIVVDLGGGVEGVIHVTELSRKEVLHPSHVVAVGQVIRAKVLRVDASKNHIGLSMRAADASP